MMRAPEMMGFESPGDQKVQVTVRDWSALKQAAWRAKKALEIAATQAKQILELCRHDPECRGAADETVPCPMTCPDREQRMSALVILNAARAFAAVDVKKPAANQPYFAPSREYFSEVLADLESTRIELEQFKLECTRLRAIQTTGEEATFSSLPAHEERALNETHTGK